MIIYALQLIGYDDEAAEFLDWLNRLQIMYSVRGEGELAETSFWMVDNLALAGRIDEAYEFFDRLVSYASDLGLFSEEIDPQSGALRVTIHRALHIWP